LDTGKLAEAVDGEGEQVSDLEFPEWQRPYIEALMEFDKQKLIERVGLAETAILSRLSAIKISAESRTEAQALEDAPRGLGFLRREGTTHLRGF
jgi:hypothetical protein